MSYGPPPPPGWGFGPPPPPPSPASQGAAIGALIANIIGLCLCWVLAIVGVILAIVGITMTQSNPSAAKTCTIISYVLFAVGTGLYALLLLFYGGMGLLGMFGDSSSYY